jgi:protein-disulfide isomerase
MAGDKAAPAPPRTQKVRPVLARDTAPLEAGRPVATLDGKPIAYWEIEGKISAAVRKEQAEHEQRVYELRRQALDHVIAMRLVEIEAKKAGKPADLWMQEDYLARSPEPTEEALRKAYDENKGSLGGATFDESRDRLRTHLRALEGQRQFGAYLQQLREEHAVKVLLVEPEPYRHPVDPIGPARGSPDAKVTIVEFSDFQCPYCSRAGSTVARVLKEYEGKVRLVYRHLPLAFHPNAQKAAEASLCAADQGKFWELHDRMFADQAKLSPADLKASARELGLDGQRFDGCLDGGEKRTLVEADARAAQALGVEGTPAFYVNGVFLNGAVPFEQFQAAVDRELRAR